jgi:hypothetical protein
VSKGTAQTIVLVMFGILLAMAALKPQGSRYKQVWASAVWSSGLAVFADLVPELVGPLAVLIVIASAAKNPGALGGIIAGAGKPASSSPSVGTGQPPVGPTGPVGKPNPNAGAPAGPVGPVGAAA